VNVLLFVASGCLFPHSFSFSTEILVLRGTNHLQVLKRSAQRNSSFQKLFSLPAEEFLINDFACAIKRKIPIQVVIVSVLFEVLERHLDSGENISLPSTEEN
jgi:hypothetical protein